MYEYRCKILKVVDGDTVDVDIDLGFGVVLSDERVRIMGIDTPESRTSDKVEKLFGIAAKNALKGMLGKTSILKTQINKDGEDMKGKFGRILGDFIIDLNGKPISIVDALMDAGHCVDYYGGSKEELTERHMANRQRLISEGVIDMKAHAKAVAYMEKQALKALKKKK
jgi:micrococcal nuclease